MIASLLPVASKLLGKFIEDKDTKNKLAHEIATMAEKHAQALAMEQIKVNQEEAKGNWFQCLFPLDLIKSAASGDSGTGERPPPVVCAEPSSARPPAFWSAWRLREQQF